MEYSSSHYYGSNELSHSLLSLAKSSPLSSPSSPHSFTSTDSEKLRATSSLRDNDSLSNNSYQRRIRDKSVDYIRDGVKLTNDHSLRQHQTQYAQSTSSYLTLGNSHFHRDTLNLDNKAENDGLKYRSELPDYEDDAKNTSASSRAFPSQSNRRYQDEKKVSNDSNTRIDRGNTYSPEYNVPQNERFLFREVFLYANEKCRSTIDLIEKLDDHVTNEGDIDEKVLQRFLNLAFGGKGNFWSSISTTADKLPKEASLLVQTHQQLEKSLRQFLLDMTQCFSTKKDVYATQIKKTRDHCNMAIRQATQAEKIDAGGMIAQLKEQYENYHTEHTASLQRELAEALRINDELGKQLKEERDAHSKYLHLKDNLIEEKVRAVQEALRAQNQEFQLEKNRLVEQLKGEQLLIREDMRHEIDKLTNHYENQLETQKNHHEEIKNLLGAERLKLENELIKLRDNLFDAQNEVKLEREKVMLKLKEETRKHEREIQQIQSEHIRENSRLKAEMQEIINRVKTEEAQRKADIDNAVSRDRDAQALTLQLQLERQQETFAFESKKLRSQIEAKRDEEITRLKSKHEQEIKKLLRDIDRLQRLPRRDKVETSAGDRQDSRLDSDSISQDQIIGTLDRKGMTSNENMPTNNFETTSDSKETSKLKQASSGETIQPTKTTTTKPANSRWSKLRESIEQQEAYLKDPIKSIAARRDPPNTLPLDEALEIAKQGANGSQPRDISLNAQKIGNYMSQLSNYLENEPMPIRTSSALNNVRALSDTSSDDRLFPFRVDSQDDSSPEYKDSAASSSLFDRSMLDNL